MFEICEILELLGKPQKKQIRGDRIMLSLIYFIFYYIMVELLGFLLIFFLSAAASLVVMAVSCV